MAESTELSAMTKKQRKEYIRSVKTSSGTSKMKYLLIGAIVVFAALALGGLFYLSSNKGSVTPKELGEKIAPPAAPNDRQHIRKGEPHVEYTSNPPSSGPHYAGVTSSEGVGPVPCEVYDKEIEDESAIHSLEHGVVWVTYKDIDDKDLASKLKNIVDDYSKVLMSPRSKNDSTIALVSWARVLKLDSLDEQKVRDFIKLYRSSADAPERFANCGTTHPLEE